LKKELKEQIKQDEFASGLEKAFAWAQAHKDELRIGGGVALVLLAVVGGIIHFRSQRALEADRAFRDALASFQAPVAGDLPPGSQPPGGTTYPNAQEKYKTAAAAFEGVERRYGSSEVGVQAEYYAALARIELKQYAEAEKALKDVQARGTGLLPELARYAMAGLYRNSGQTDKAVELYRSLATNPRGSIPPDFALWSAATTLDDAKRWAEARRTYRQLVEQFPASLYSAQARSRAEYLETAQG
jgi:tetratricopeptide (TPR) repeat protein